MSLTNNKMVTDTYNLYGIRTNCEPYSSASAKDLETLTRWMSLVA